MPRKNLRLVGGETLVARTVHALAASTTLSAIYVSTDDAQIAEAAIAAGALVIERPADLASDTATSEGALLHALGHLTDSGIRPDVLLFAQATSPFIVPSDVDAAVTRVALGEVDVVFSAVETYEFLWRRGRTNALGINHDPATRPRRQDREPHFRESGAFYALNATGFANARHRFFGKIGIHPVDERFSIEIDSEAELDIARAIAPLFTKAYPTLGAPIDVDAIITDFDGVHTDDTAIQAQDGSESVVVSRSDGMGVSLLRQAGLHVVILSTETNTVVAARAHKLGIPVLHGIADKAAALRQWSEQNAVPLERIAYVGNDVNDLGCLSAVGWPIAMPSSHPAVLAASRHVLSVEGGHGAVRELAELILSSRIDTPSTP